MSRALNIVPRAATLLASSGGTFASTSCSVERWPAVAQEPAGGPLDQATPLEEHPGLRLGLDPGIQGLDLGPQLAHVEDLAHRRVRPREVGRGRPSLLLEP